MTHYIMIIYIIHIIHNDSLYHPYHPYILPRKLMSGFCSAAPKIEAVKITQVFSHHCREEMHQTHLDMYLS